MGSFDGISISIDGKVLKSNWREGDYRVVDTPPVYLRTGGHIAVVNMFQVSKNYRFSVKIKGPGIPKQFMKAN